MKIISLNTWGARAGHENMYEFIRKNIDVDIFCFQEAWEGGQEFSRLWSDNIDTGMNTNIGAILKDHTLFFRPHVEDYYGLAMFVKKDLVIVDEGEVYVYKERGWMHDEFKGNHARNLQYVTLHTPSGLKTILNFHGIWNGQGKEDTEDRLLQSDNILKFLNSIDNPFVLMGDFNLLPETKSIKVLEDNGLKNLIKENGITSTRSSHYKKPLKFADYAFVSEGIKVNEFKVLPDEVSDHLAMYIDIE